MFTVFVTGKLKLDLAYEGSKKIFYCLLHVMIGTYEDGVSRQAGMLPPKDNTALGCLNPVTV